MNTNSRDRRIGWVAGTLALATFLWPLPADGLEVHEQISDKERLWFDLAVAEKPVGRLSIPAGNLWLHGKEYPLSAYDPMVGTGPFQLWIERTDTGADYLLDLIGEESPVSFGEGVGAVLVAWREQPGGPIHVLRSVQDE